MAFDTGSRVRRNVYADGIRAWRDTKSNGADVAGSRRMETGSWLGLPFQGQGLGTRMRRMMCALAFDGLGLDAVTSSDDADNSKPEPDILVAALEEAGGRRGVLVGDATWDAESAGRVPQPGMLCVAVRTGGFSAAELKDAGAVAVYDAVTDLRDGAWIDELA